MSPTRSSKSLREHPAKPLRKYLEKNTVYRPLPPFLTIKPSDIEGVGLFALDDIPARTNLGISHYFWKGDLVRTPLGGFYNHSDNPNCYTVVNNDYAELITLRDVDAGEEITATYCINPLSTRSSVG